MADGLRREDVEAWLAARPSWAAGRLAALAGFVLVFALSLATPPVAACPSASSCGDETLAAVTLGIAGVAIVALWHWPPTGALVGAVAALLALPRDPTAVTVGFVAVALALCSVVARHHVLARRRQRVVADARRLRLPGSVASNAARSPGASRSFERSTALVLAVLAVLAGGVVLALRGEPGAQDRFDWLVGAVLLMGVGLLVVGQDLVGARARRRRPETGVRVLLTPGEDDSLLVRTLDGIEVATYRPMELGPRTAEPVERTTQWWLVGDIRTGGWAWLSSDIGARPPDAPLCDVGTATDLLRPEPSSRATLAWHVVGVVLGVGLIAAGLGFGADPLTAATGGGVRGSFTVIEGCSGDGCSVVGRFSGDDGRTRFDEAVYEREGDVGEVLPAVYVGDGHRPVTVHSPGWDEVALWGAALAAGVGFAGWPVVVLVRGRRPAARTRTKIDQ